MDSGMDSGFLVRCNICPMRIVTDTKADLGLAGGITNQWENSNENSNAAAAAFGAGANATFTDDLMAFVEADALAELVWSPGAGLRVKITDRKPCLIREAGPSNMKLSRSENNSSKDCSIASRASCHVSGEVDKPCSSVNTPRSTSHGHTGPQNQRTDDPLSEHIFEDGATSGVDRSGADYRQPSKINAMMPSVLEEHFEMDNAKMENTSSFSDYFRETARNAILQNAKSAEHGDSIPGEEDTASSFNRHENHENHEVESHGSMESCKSANVVTERKRRSSFEQELILGSKRIKKQAQEYADKKNSSFTNWISNIVKGTKNPVHSDRRISVRDENQNTESKKMGFQSLFLPDVKAQETVPHTDKKFVVSSREMDLAGHRSHHVKAQETVPHTDKKFIVGSREMDLAGHRSHDMKAQETVPHTEKKFVLSSREMDLTSHRSHDVKAQETVPHTEKKFVLSSREMDHTEKRFVLSSREMDHTEKRFVLSSREMDHTEKKFVLSSREMDLAGHRSHDVKAQETVPHTEKKFVLSSREMDHTKKRFVLSSREMDHTEKKFILSSREMDLAGHRSHDVKAQETVPHTEKKFVLSSREMDPTKKRFVLSSRETDHTEKKFVLSSREMDLAGHRSHDVKAQETVPHTEKKFVLSSREMDLAGHRSHDVKAQETVPYTEKKFVLSSREMDLAGHRSHDCLEVKEKEVEGLVKHKSLYERVTNEPPNEMFDTIRRLRLSRIDIYKWTESRSSIASLDGFFLRVRLTKSKCEEEGVGVSIYYVACITGRQVEDPSKGFKEQPIRVKIGEVEDFIESRYISNSEFLEEELVAWWQNRYNHGETPTLKDLKYKLAERATLGLC